jgi:hypothetical protein
MTRQRRRPVTVFVIKLRTGRPGPTTSECSVGF